MDSVYSTYKLSDDEHNEYLKEIEFHYLNHISAIKTPTIVIIGGQPGSGKTQIIPEYNKKFFSDDNVCIINGDDLRRFHPKSDYIFKNHEEEYSLFTEPDTRLWTSSLLSGAIDKKVNIIFECTMRTPQICVTISMLKERGYKIVIVAMAVPYIISAYWICKRYLDQKQLGFCARLVSYTTHDDAYTGMINTLKEIIDTKHYNSIFAWGRKLNSPKRIFLGNDANLPKKIITYRVSPFTPEELLNYYSNCKSLRAGLIKFGKENIYTKFCEKIIQYQKNSNKY